MAAKRLAPGTANEEGLEQEIVRFAFMVVLMGLGLKMPCSALRVGAASALGAETPDGQ